MPIRFTQNGRSQKLIVLALEKGLFARGLLSSQRGLHGPQLGRARLPNGLAFSAKLQTWIVRYKVSRPKDAPSRQPGPSALANLRGQPTRHSLLEFQTTGRSRQEDDEYDQYENDSPCDLSVL